MDSAAPPKPMTVEEFDQFVLLPENVDRAFEFIGGEIIEVVANNYSSQIAMLLGAKITEFVVANNLGQVTGADGGYWVSGERYIPDVGFISKTRQPQPSHETYNPNPPDLAVEVLSPTNDPTDVRIKIVNYLRAGTTVWLVNPDKQRVEVYAPDAAPKTFGIEDVLEGGKVLPDFKLAVRDIFPK